MLFRSGPHAYCAYAGRRDGKNFLLNDSQVAEKYGNRLKMNQRIPEVLAGAMGNQMFVALFDTKEEMDLFYQDVLSCRE